MLPEENEPAFESSSLEEVLSCCPIYKEKGLLFLIWLLLISGNTCTKCFRWYRFFSPASTRGKACILFTAEVVTETWFIFWLQWAIAYKLQSEKTYHKVIYNALFKISLHFRILYKLRTTMLLQPLLRIRHQRRAIFFLKVVNNGSWNFTAHLWAWSRFLILRMRLLWIQIRRTNAYHLTTQRHHH